MRFAPLFASWRENIIPMSRRTKRPPKKSLRKSTKPTKSWAIRRSERNTISLARIGISLVDFSPLPDGGRSSLAADFINTAAATVGSNSNLAELGSAISSRRFSAVAAGVQLLVGSADVRQQPSAGVMSKRTSWLRSRRLSMDRQERFRCAARVQTRRKVIKSRSRAAFMKANASGSPVREERERAAAKAAISSYAFGWRDITISRLKEAI